MRTVICPGLSALLFTIAGLPALASETLADGGLAASPNMSFNFTAPFISSSGLRGDNHIIKVMVLGMALEDLTVSIPRQMAKFSKIRLQDDTGEAIPATIESSESAVKVTFDQPVQPGRTIALNLSGVSLHQEAGRILLYGVMGRRQGLRSSIPIGTARIQVPSIN